MYLLFKMKFHQSKLFCSPQQNLYLCLFGFFSPWQPKASQGPYCSGFQRAIVYLCGYK